MHVERMSHSPEIDGMATARHYDPSDRGGDGYRHERGEPRPDNFLRGLIALTFRGRLVLAPRKNMGAKTPWAQVYSSGPVKAPPSWQLATECLRR